MKRIFLVLFFALFSLCTPGTSSFVYFAFAAETADGLSPDDTIRDAVKRLKDSKSLLVLLEYVDWDKAFKKLPPDELVVMNLRNGEDYRLYVYTKIATPKESLEQEAKAFLQTVPEAERERIDRDRLNVTVSKMAADMKVAFDKVRETFVNASYTIGKSRIEGDQAYVTVTSNLEGPMETGEVLMEKNGNKWLFPSLEVFLGPNEERPVRMQSMEELLRAPRKR
ncbi:MAG: hypothetical protein KDD66_00935 [Bdellovibrionales bacterium]|nr:hypothetical protein [Bdellovibrionales bacterium]